MGAGGGKEEKWLLTQGCGKAMDFESAFRGQVAWDGCRWTVRTFQMIDNPSICREKVLVVRIITDRSWDYPFEGELHVSMFEWGTVAIIAINSGKSIKELLIHGPHSKPGTTAYLSKMGMKSWGPCLLPSSENHNKRGNQLWETLCSAPLAVGALLHRSEMGPETLRQQVT